MTRPGLYDRRQRYEERARFLYEVLDRVSWTDLARALDDVIGNNHGQWEDLRRALDNAADDRGGAS